ncbi:MAG: hypothetical protein R3C56_37235 [Pirellulaceae bacterium]
MILVDGCVYAFNDRGILYCWRASDGQQMWRERLEGPVSRIADLRRWASLLGQRDGNRIRHQAEPPRKCSLSPPIDSEVKRLPARR